MSCKPIDVKFSEQKDRFCAEFGSQSDPLEAAFKDVGVKGASAYEIAVMRGFRGNVDEWLDSLHGKDGTFEELTDEQRESLRGKPGYTPQKGVDYFDGKPGYTPVRGEDYWTETDKQEIVEEVLEQVPSGGGASVQADWNQNDPEQPNFVKNRPFYEVPPNYEITWDGDMTGRTAVDLSILGSAGVYLVKVSDKVYAKEELIGKCFKFNDGSKHLIYNDSFINDFPGCWLYTDVYFAIVYSADELNAALGAPDGYITNGTYFLCAPSDGVYVESLFTESIIVKVEEKYLPDAVVKYNDLRGVKLYPQRIDLAGKDFWDFFYYGELSIEERKKYLFVKEQRLANLDIKINSQELNDVTFSLFERDSDSLLIGSTVIMNVGNAFVVTVELRLYSGPPDYNDDNYDLHVFAKRFATTSS